MKSPSEKVIAEVSAALTNNDGNLGKVYRAYSQGMRGATEIANSGAAANAGAASNLLAVIRALLELEPQWRPKSSAVAAHVGRSIGGLLRDNPGFSDETRLYLSDLRVELDQEDEQDKARENKEFERSSEDLTKDLEQYGGIYVYTFPTYFRTPAKQDPERVWFKVGKTVGAAGQRVRQQLRSTAMPEDPWIMRVYRRPEMDVTEVETKFHDLLTAAGSRTQARYGGQEWFATSLEFLDTIASTLNLVIHKREEDI